MPTEQFNNRTQFNSGKCVSISSKYPQKFISLFVKSVSKIRIKKDNIRYTLYISTFKKKKENK